MKIKSGYGFHSFYPARSRSSYSRPGNKAASGWLDEVPPKVGRPLGCQSLGILRRASECPLPAQPPKCLQCPSSSPSSPYWHSYHSGSLFFPVARAGHIYASASSGYWLEWGPEKSPLVSAIPWVRFTGLDWVWLSIKYLLNTYCVYKVLQRESEIN